VYSQFFGNAYFSKPAQPTAGLTLPKATSTVTPPVTPPVTSQSQPSVITQPQTVGTSQERPVTKPQPQPVATLKQQPVASSATVNPSITFVTRTNNKDGASNLFTSVSDFGAWLFKQPDNSGGILYNVKLNVKNLTGVKDVLKAAPNKYIDLDLSDNSFLSIDDEAFNACTSLISVNLPNTVASIGQYSFYDCINLVSVIIPDRVTSIRGGAFYNCKSLVSITIPNNVTNIGNYAFYGCTNLANVAIGSGVINIGEGAFNHCNSLPSIIIPNKVTSIGRNAFNSCGSLIKITFQGNIPLSGFGTKSVFPGDLRNKFYAKDKINGTPGTYTRVSGGEIWTLQYSNNGVGMYRKKTLVCS
jgi:hypothetical protein